MACQHDAVKRIIKGENLPIPGQAWRIEVVRRAAGQGVPGVTTLVLLLDAAGAAVGRPALVPADASEGLAVNGIDLDTERADPDVRRVVAVAVAESGTLGQVPGLSVRTLSVATGEALALYEVDDATTETALVLGEYYRRDGAWKFRAVGEGYDAGLEALAKDFGIPVPTPAPGGPGPVELPGAALGKTADPSGPGPVELPHAAVGKSAGPAVDTEPDQGSGAPPRQGPGDGPGPKTGWDGTHGSGSGASQASAQGPSQPRSGPRPPSPGQGSLPVLASPAPSPEALAAAAVLGGEFDDIVYSGRGSAKFAMDAAPPPGFVLVDLARTGTGFFDLDSVDWDGREAVDLGDADTSHRFERRVMWCDNLYPLRFRVGCDDHDEWTIVIRPVSAARPLGETATGRGPEVLLHTGPVGELVSRLRPAKGSGSLWVEGHKPRRPDTPARYPVPLASELGRSPQAARELPEGPLLVAVVRGAGEWSLEVLPPGTVPPQEKRSGFWRRIRGS